MAERAYDDVDLLVAPEQFQPAEAALRDLGLLEARLEAVLPESRPEHAHTWVTHDGRAVDLHRTLVGVAGSPDRLWAALYEQARPLHIEDQCVLVPSDAGLALIVTLHAGQHVDRSHKPLEDLERALERLSPAAWARSVDLAREVDALDAFAAGLSLSPRGAVRLKELGLRPRERATSRRSGGTAFHVAQGLSWLRQTPGLRGKLALLHERLLPSRRAMRQRSNLARRGAAGLGAAYVLRLLDAARTLPSVALASWRNRG